MEKNHLVWVNNQVWNIPLARYTLWHETQNLHFTNSRKARGGLHYCYDLILLDSIPGSSLRLPTDFIVSVSVPPPVELAEMLRRNEIRKTWGGVWGGGCRVEG